MSERSELVSAVLGAVLGDLDGDEVGARHRGHRPRHVMALPPKPAWRNSQIVPGVNAPSEGKEPLPLVPDVQSGTFTATGSPIINFKARPQRPFHPQRLLAQVLRTGSSASGLAAVCQGIFVGTALQQLQLGGFNVEFFGATAFDVMLSMTPCEAGIDVVLPMNLTGALTSTDTINVQLLILGQTLR
jgi:hypothetical protein